MVDISEYKGQSIKHNDGLENKVESYSPKLIKYMLDTNCMLYKKYLYYEF